MKKTYVSTRLLLVLLGVSLFILGGALFLTLRIESQKKVTEEKASSRLDSRLQISKSFSAQNNIFYYQIVGRFAEPISSDESSGTVVSKFIIEGDASKTRFPVLLPGKYNSISYGVQDPNTMAIEFSFREVDYVFKDIKIGDLVEFEITTKDESYVKLLDSLIETNSTSVPFVLNPSRIVKLKQ